MCDRYRLRSQRSEVQGRHPGIVVKSAFAERFKICSGQHAPVVLRGSAQAVELVDLRWGLEQTSAIDPDADTMISNLPYHDAATKARWRAMGNARYQRSRLMVSVAEELGIELLYQPPYSP